MTASLIKDAEHDTINHSHNLNEANLCIALFEKFIDKPPDGNSSSWIRRLSTNRWLRTTAYGVVTMNCCAIYFGWQQFQKILFQGGTYAWLCTENTNQNDKALHICDSQNAKVQMLYTIASAMEYIVGVVAGVSLDHLGPRACGLTGMMVLLIGLLLLMVSSQSIQLYIPSMILLGGSVNLIAFPALLAGDFFPGHQALVIAFIVACQIGCASVAIILLEIWRAHPDLSMGHLFGGYLCIVWIPCCILYFVFLPCRRRIIQSSCSESPFGLPSTEVPPMSDDQTEMQSEMSHIVIDSEQAVVGLSKRRIKIEPHQPNSVSEDQNTVVLKGNWKHFFEELITWDVEIFAAYYVAQLLQFIYYPTTTLSLFDVQMSDFAGYIMPTQVIWGIIFGWLVDRVGTLPLCCFINTLNVIVFSFTLIRNYSLQYVAVLANCIAQSFIYTSKYTYVTEIYSPHNFGKLAGYIGFLGGIFTFLNIPISASTNYDLWCLVFLGVCGFCYAALAILVYRKRRGIHHVKSVGDHRHHYDNQTFSGDSPTEYVIPNPPLVELAEASKVE